MGIMQLMDEGWERTERPPRPDPAEHISDWDEALEQAQADREALARHTQAVSSAGWFRRRFLHRQSEHLLQAKLDSVNRLRRLAQRARETGLGSNPGEWSALSVIDPEVSLENTLSALQGELPQPWGNDTLKRLPWVRVDSARGDQTVLVDLHAQLLEQVAALPAHAATALEEHLPGRLRRIPGTLADMRRSDGLMTLHISDPLDDGWGDESKPRALSGRIYLHDIVCMDQGHGLGTAVLEHLCAFADAHKCTISGELEPGPGYTGEVGTERVRRLAHWYARHGFTQGNRHPDQWRRQGSISRKPHLHRE